MREVPHERRGGQPSQRFCTQAQPAASKQFDGLRSGATLRFRGQTWNIVGIFSTNGDAHESELWTDAETAQSAFSRSGVSSILVSLSKTAAKP